MRQFHPALLQEVPQNTAQRPGSSGVTLNLLISRQCGVTGLI